MTLYETISNEFDRVGLIRVPAALERLTCSVGCHIFNYSNLLNPRFHDGGSLEDFRMNLVFMAPSGYGKSKFLSFFLNPKVGMLSRSLIPTAMEGTFSKESWLGTIQNGEQTHGIIQQYKNGIVGADEYMKLRQLMGGNGEAHDEVYLMQALSSDRSTKNLSYGRIELNDVGMTFWAGMRYSSLGLESGLARRFCFQIFMPTFEDAAQFRKAARSKEKKRNLDPLALDKISEDINKAILTSDKMTEIDYTPLHEWVDKCGLAVPHFEEELYRRMAVGWAVANDYLPEIKLDEPFTKLLQDELRTRDIIRNDPTKGALIHIVQDAERIKKSSLKLFLKRNYQMNEVVAESYLRELKHSEFIKEEDGWIEFIYEGE